MKLMDLRTSQPGPQRSRGGKTGWLPIVVLAAALAGSGSMTRPGQAAVPGPAASFYFNGDILTMEGVRPTQAEALVEKDGIIVFVGRRADAERRYPQAIKRDLRGKTLLPGFIDSHGHLYLTGFLTAMANVMPAPDGPGTNHDALVSSTRAWIDSPTGKVFMRRFGWVLANGYDHSLMPEGTPPTAEVLDRISTGHPVMLIHQSGHIASINSKGLERAGYTRETPDPAGGIIQRGADGNPNGVLEESAFNAVANLILGQADAEIDALAIARGQDLYARGGYTTAEDARAFPNITNALAQAAEAGRIRLDVISYPDIAVNAKALESRYYSAERSYRQHYRIGGAKISLDGSPQAKTAWLTHPYHVSPPHADAAFKGYAAMPDQQAFALFAQAARKGWQILCHANGDAAIDQCLNGVAHAQALHPNPDHRSVVIHGQTMRTDQIARLAALKMLPSFFAAHTYYWGDYHRDSVLGMPRAARISPTREALQHGLTLTTHHDAPVILPSAMRIVDATVNRTTRSGKLLGPEQRLLPYEALKAITIWAAIQHFEENRKGTLAVGKRADLAILSANPVRVNPATIKDIRVVATIKDGTAIYCDDAASRAAICSNRMP